MYMIDPTSRILSIDPGLTCGFASWTSNFDERSAWEAKLTHDQFIDALNEFLPDIIICESFVHTQRTNVDYTPVEFIGLTKWFASRRNVALEFQTPAYGKAFFDNDKLKHMRIYLPGKPHAMDALRHLLQFKVKHGEFDMRLLK